MKRLDAVGKVGKGQELTTGESIEKGGLVDTVERARLNFTDTAQNNQFMLAIFIFIFFKNHLRILGHDQLDNPVTSLKVTVTTVHGNINSWPSRRVKRDSSSHTLRQTRVGHFNVLAQVLPLDFTLAKAPGESNKVVHTSPGAHETIAEVRVLVEGKVLAAKVEFVLVLALDESLVRVGGELGFKDNLSGSTTEVHDGKRVVRIGPFTNLVEEIVGGDPSVDT